MSAPSLLPFSTSFQSTKCSWKTLIGASVVLGCILSLTDSVAAAGLGFNRRADDPNNSFYQSINTFQQFVNTERNTLDASKIGARTLDASKLTLKADQNISVFFINEGANYRNQLGLNMSGTTSINNQLLFSDLTCTSGCQYTGYRSPSNQFGTPDNKPLEIGDYFNLGTVKSGTSLDFFLRQDGYNNQYANNFYAQSDRNVDKIQHLIAYDYNDFLVLAWEDLTNGGDKDYNDVVFALDIGANNINQIQTLEAAPSSPSLKPSAGTPEPLNVAGAMFATVVGYFFKKQTQANCSSLA